MNKSFIIDGNSISNISDFYNEINRLLMKNEDWQLGESLDALDDALYGGYGELIGIDSPHFIWSNSENSRAALGIDVTRAYYLNKINQPEYFNVKLFQEKLKKLEEGTGETYFEILLDIFKSHQNITLVLR